MEFIIGQYKEKYDKVLKLLQENKKENDKNYYMFFADDVSDLYEKILNKLDCDNAIVRIPYNSLFEENITLCKIYGIKVSIVFYERLNIEIVEKVIKNWVTIKLILNL